VLGGGAAAAADQGQAELAGEGVVRLRQFLGAQRVMGAVLGQLGQSGVRHGTDRQPGMTGQMPQVFTHLGRPGRAVQPDGVDAERRHRCQGGADLTAEQEGARGLDGDLDDDR
jgi:hypothetical protein